MSGIAVKSTEGSRKNAACLDSRKFELGHPFPGSRQSRTLIQWLQIYKRGKRGRDKVPKGEWGIDRASHATDTLTYPTMRPVRAILNASGEFKHQVTNVQSGSRKRRRFPF